MAPKSPVSLALMDTLGGIYWETRTLVERSGAITTDERRLMDQLAECVVLAWETNYARARARTAGEGCEDTEHQRRMRREVDQQIAHFREDHAAWVASLSPARSRQVIPFARPWQSADIPA